MLQPIDERCSGCTACRLACAITNYQAVSPSLALLRIEGRFPSPGTYRIHLCDQCGACAEACPEEAIRNDGGIYRIDSDLCSGCQLCVEACPNDVIVIHTGKDVPQKCILCGACVEVCPRGAIQFQSHGREVA